MSCEFVEVGVEELVESLAPHFRREGLGNAKCEVDESGGNSGDLKVEHDEFVAVPEKVVDSIQQITVEREFAAQHGESLSDEVGRRSERWLAVVG